MNSQQWANDKKTYFDTLTARLFEQLTEGESLTAALTAEDSLFARLNQSQFRQVSQVKQASLELTFIIQNREITKSLMLQWNLEVDTKSYQNLLQQARKEAAFLPESAFVVLPTNNGNSEQVQLLPEAQGENLLEKVVDPISDYDVAGLLTNGIVIRANANSAGQKHWFCTENFYFDYSMYSAKQKAVKACYAGDVWNQSEYSTNISNSAHQLSLMAKPVQKVERGKYRTYLAPAAVGEFMSTLNWRGFGSGLYKQGGSSLTELFEGKKSFSSMVSITEDFTQGFSPRFNSNGEVFSEQLKIVENGKMVNSLVATKTAKEYTDLKSNAASDSEKLRSPRMHEGELRASEILKELGTGLFLSNLHYLNYSDYQKARITGMTRFACFWVESGEIVGPIQDLRFDETAYNILGDKLVAITNFSEVQPLVETYDYRHIGGARYPGLLVDDFSFTL